MPFAVRMTSSMRHLIASASVAKGFGFLKRCCHTSREVRVRFAPSPTGYLHLGGLRTALYNYLFSRACKGKFILRIEDTDQSRLVPGAVEQLVEMLSWSGIHIDEGPFQGGSLGPYIQSQRLLHYKEHAKQLLENGSAYCCFCTPHRLELIRKQATARGEVPKYDNRCRHLSHTEVQEKLSSNLPFVIRFKLNSYTEPWHDLVYGPIVYDVAQIEGDPILLKSDGFPTYHLANVVDDHLMEISHVLRGIEWQSSTTKHVLLYKAFGWNLPVFAHLPLLKNKDGKKLSKRQNDVHVEHFKNAGHFPSAVLNLLTNMGSGFTVRETAGMDMQQLIEHFDLSKLSTNSTRIDFDKLTEFDRLHLKKAISSSGEKYAELISDLRRKVLEKFSSDNSKKDLTKHLERILTDEYLKRVLEWSKERISLVSDLLQPQYSFLWLLPASEKLDSVGESSETAVKMIKETIAAVQTISDSDFNQNSITSAINAVSSNKTWKYSQYMKILRKSLTGSLIGPPVAEIIALLGKEIALNQLNQVLHSSREKTASQNLVSN